MAVQTRSQKLAKIVYDQVKNVGQGKEEKEREKYRRKYGALCHKFPAFILTNGLMQTVAFFKSKEEDKEHFKEFLTHIRNTFSEEGLCTNQTDLHDWIMGLKCTEYMLATRRALEASVWYVRFAESILKVKKGEEAEGER